MSQEFTFPFPEVIRIEPAAGCNLACSHCPTGTISMKRGVMSKEVFEKILRTLRARRNEIHAVVLSHGGEALLNKNFFHMVRAVKEIGIPFVKTVSNGMLLNDEAIEALIDSGIDAIEISTDGDSPQANDFIRVNSDFGTIIGNVKRLIDAKRERGADKPAIIICQVQFVEPERFFFREKRNLLIV